ncbi:MAG: sulfite exporter TauE/SafE family protein [Bacillota bacterium]
MLKFLGLLVLGIIVGSFGTLIGAGGGFVLVPILLLLYPAKSPDLITSISLAVVFFNALSGSFAYFRQKRVDFKSGILFAIASTPGAIFGAYLTSLIPRRIFDGIFGFALIISSAFLLLKPEMEPAVMKQTEGGDLIQREVTDSEGTTYQFAYNRFLGISLSFIVGFISSLLGIGGGIIHVPILVYLLNFPVHIATATSHLVLAIMAFFGTLVHLLTGSLRDGYIQTLTISIGVIGGAQIGAYFSRFVREQWIMNSLAVALGLVGIRILLLAFNLPVLV